MGSLPPCWWLLSLICWLALLSWAFDEEGARSSSLNSLLWPFHPVMWLKNHLYSHDAHILTSNVDFSAVLVQIPKCLLDVSTWVVKRYIYICVVLLWTPCPKQRYGYSPTEDPKSFLFRKMIIEAWSSRYSQQNSNSQSWLRFLKFLLKLPSTDIQNLTTLQFEILFSLP